MLQLEAQQKATAIIDKNTESFKKEPTEMTHGFQADLSRALETIRNVQEEVTAIQKDKDRLAHTNILQDDAILQLQVELEQARAPNSPDSQEQQQLFQTPDQPLQTLPEPESGDGYSSMVYTQRSIPDPTGQVSVPPSAGSNRSLVASPGIGQDMPSQYDVSALIRVINEMGKSIFQLQDRMNGMETYVANMMPVHKTAMHKEHETNQNHVNKEHNKTNTSVRRSIEFVEFVESSMRHL